MPSDWDPKQVSPWDRLEGEPQEAYACFLSWIREPRPLVKIAKAYRRSEGEIDEWRRRWGWERRRAEYEIHLSLIAIPAETERTAHLAAAQLASAKAAAHTARAWEARAAYLAAQPAAAMDPSEVARLARVAQRERSVPVVSVVARQADDQKASAEAYARLSTEELLILRQARDIEAKLAGS